MCGTFRRISQLWDDAQTLNLENCLLYLLSTISQFFDFVRCIVFDFIFYCVTAHTLYMINPVTITGKGIIKQLMKQKKKHAKLKLASDCKVMPPLRVPLKSFPTFLCYYYPCFEPLHHCALCDWSSFSAAPEEG